ncbi:nitrous oxide-stimulated promoter family protein [Symbiopectobacterium purcellii]|uniref:Nitrous oxide-stimulated promoter family protein n=2 Tax=Symbiopectobacterium purcellii TaxID=2871826 RepID=A0ABX9AS63_9ENTR|nr:nitrous oxide-stimulated promoter family protein [Symbiopectobacterium purcellii]
MGKYRLRELHTILLMIDLYEKHHPADEGDGERYQQLSAYATNRLERCQFGEEKQACKHCPIHCYQPARREQIRAIMRWSGPRMLLHHPILAIRHLIDDHRPVPAHTPRQETATRVRQPQIASPHHGIKKGR